MQQEGGFGLNPNLSVVGEDVGSLEDVTVKKPCSSPAFSHDRKQMLPAFLLQADYTGCSVFQEPAPSRRIMLNPTKRSPPSMPNRMFALDSVRTEEGCQAACRSGGKTALSSTELSAQLIRNEQGCSAMGMLVPSWLPWAHVSRGASSGWLLPPCWAANEAKGSTSVCWRICSS